MLAKVECIRHMPVSILFLLTYCCSKLHILFLAVMVGVRGAQLLLKQRRSMLRGARRFRVFAVIAWCTYTPARRLIPKADFESVEHL